MLDRRLLIAAAAAVLILVPSAAADEAYTDAVGDQVNGAPDITSVRVRNDAAGTLIFSVAATGFPSSSTDLFLFIDADGNGSTGDQGVDYEFGVDASNPNATFAYRWDGSSWVTWAPSTARAGFQAGVWTVVVNAAELGTSLAFDFYYSASRYSGQQQLGRDDAPDGDAWYTYVLTQPEPAPRPTPPQPSPPVMKSYEDAPRLPARVRYVGKSIKHVRLGEKLYDTMQRLTREGLIRVPRVVGVACWSKADWPSVAESAGADVDPNRLKGFWYARQPRWVHVAPKQCSDVQALMLTRQSNGQRAYALVTVLHERVHAEYVRHEAQTNCYAVQLVYDFARALNFVPQKALRLEQLAVRKARAVAPRGYWDASRCRDGGRWDLYPEFINLTY